MEVQKGLPGGSCDEEAVHIWETWILSLGWEDPLEKGMVTRCNILAWIIPWAKKSVKKGWKRLVQRAHWQPVINRTTVILGFVVRVALRSELQLCMLC